jgi:hypothetical protein
VREAGKAGITPPEAVEVCARKSWQGFNASWEWRGAAATGPQRSKQAALEARNAAVVADLLGEIHDAH